MYCCVFYICHSFLLPWSCLSSGLTISVCPFGIFEFLLTRLEKHWFWKAINRLLIAPVEAQQTYNFLTTIYNVLFMLSTGAKDRWMKIVTITVTIKDIDAFWYSHNMVLTLWMLGHYVTLTTAITSCLTRVEFYR